MKKILTIIIGLCLIAATAWGFGFNDRLINPTTAGVGYRRPITTADTSGTYWETAMTAYWETAMTDLWDTAMNTEVSE